MELERGTSDRQNLQLQHECVCRKKHETVKVIPAIRFLTPTEYNVAES
jgi:hypothetical protein